MLSDLCGSRHPSVARPSDQGNSAAVHGRYVRPGEALLRSSAILRSHSGNLAGVFWGAALTTWPSGRIPLLGETVTTLVSDDATRWILDACRMGILAIDLARQAASLTWLVSPVGLVSLVAILGLVFTGIPGRIILEVETKLAWRKELRRRRLDRDDNDDVLVAVTYMEREE